MKTIAVDIDDVLAISVPEFIKYSNEKWGTNLSINDYTEHWAEIWNVDNDEVGLRSKHFHDITDFTEFKTIIGGEQVLRLLSKKYKIVIATARKLQIEKETLKWIEKHYSGLFSEVYFAGIWDNITDKSISATKTELCKKIGADYLIDDQLKHCISASELGIKTVLFGDYPWNQCSDLPITITRCSDWTMVKKYFDEQ